MPCVRLPSHLHRSPYGVYHFRLVLPAALAEATGTREIWRSLRTKDPVRVGARFYERRRTAPDRLATRGSSRCTTHSWGVSAPTG
ncbi:DUF6538 domain-containing protein [Burkholderia gladioli]|uniref:DUF6538 domain-containing protein n=1 Tax=Burkholderia gladioli TaxID=28095 RepID=UPI003016EDBF